MKPTDIKLVKDLSNELKYTLLVEGNEAGVINIPKDQFLKSVSYTPGTYVLNLVFETTSGEMKTDVDLSDLHDVLDSYTKGEIDAKLSATTKSIKDLSDNVYIKTEIDNKYNVLDKRLSTAESGLTNTYTKKEVDKLISDIVIPDDPDVELPSNIKDALKVIYPIGCVYLCGPSGRPSTRFGFGKWEQVGQGKVLVGVGTYTDQNGDGRTFKFGDESVNNEKGEYKHTLQLSEIPSHSHNVDLPTKNGSGKQNTLSLETNSGARTTIVTSTAVGDGSAHNNMPPFYAVEMWYGVQ